MTMYLGVVSIHGIEADECEPIEVVGIDEAGIETLSSIIRPRNMPHYTGQHGIRAEHLVGAPQIDVVQERIRRMISTHDQIVIWAADHYVSMLGLAPGDLRIRCATKAYLRTMEQGNRRYGRVGRLLSVAEAIGYDGPCALSPRYRAANRARATRHIWLACTASH